LMNEQIEYTNLLNDIKRLGADNPRTKLVYDLTGKHPEKVSAVAYDKGCRFLKALEFAYGRETFDAFLKKYFSQYAFHTMTTEKLIDYLNKHLIQKYPLSTSNAVRVYNWIYNPGLPARHPVPDSPEFRKVDNQRAAFIQGKSAAEIDTSDWTSLHWVHFIQALPAKLTTTQMADLNNNFELTSTNNSEIAFAWYKQAITLGYTDAFPAIEKFLTNVGRIKFVKPLYKTLAVETNNRDFALKVYNAAKKGYHPLTISEIDEILATQQ